MLELDELVSAYIECNIPVHLHSVLGDSLTLMQKFSVPEYDERLVDIVLLGDTIEKDTIQDLFYANIKNTLLSVIGEHGIRINTDVDVSIAELNEVLFCLMLVQHLEDVSLLDYKVHAFIDNRQKLAELLSLYSRLTLLRALEILGEVDEKLIDALKLMVKDKEDSGVCLESMYLSSWNEFSSYTKGIDCVGKRLRDTGYFNMEIKNTLNLCREDVWGSVRLSYSSSPSKAALDVFSLLMLCKDCYQTPLLSYDKYAYMFVETVEQISVIRNVLLAMVNDFNEFMTAKKLMVEKQAE